MYDGGCVQRSLSSPPVVISPGIDPLVFDCAGCGAVAGVSSPLHDVMRRAVFAPSITIGYIGRLAKEKSPGLFLMAVHEIMETLKALRLKNIKVRFAMLGDGPLLESLKNLAALLKVEEYVDFLGGCYRKLRYGIVRLVRCGCRVAKRIQLCPRFEVTGHCSESISYLRDVLYLQH